jgi:hypothetical protein
MLAHGGPPWYAAGWSCLGWTAFREGEAPAEPGLGWTLALPATGATARSLALTRGCPADRGP